MITEKEAEIASNSPSMYQILCAGAGLMKKHSKSIGEEGVSAWPPVFFYFYFAAAGKLWLALATTKKPKPKQKLVVNSIYTFSKNIYKLKNLTFLSFFLSSFLFPTF